MDGKLNQKEGFFRVKEYAARDVRQSDIDDMIAVLTAW